MQKKQKNFSIFALHQIGFIETISFKTEHFLNMLNKFKLDLCIRFDVYWIQTKKQTDKPNLYIDIV